MIYDIRSQMLYDEVPGFLDLATVSQAIRIPLEDLKAITTIFGRTSYSPLPENL